MPAGGIGDGSAETEKGRIERRIEELDNEIREMRAAGYGPEIINTMAALIREHDDLIRRLFEFDKGTA